MKVLDKQLDTKPTKQDVRQLAELKIRNLICFNELQSYNDNKKWLYHHPLIIHQSERSLLDKLRKENPQEFLKQYAACNSNIKRYSSYIKNKGREDRRAKDVAHLKRHKERATLFNSILTNETE